MTSWNGNLLSDREAQGQRCGSEKVAKEVADLEYWKKLDKNPLLRKGMTFTEIFPVGLIVALICAATLRKTKVLPASS